MDQDCTAYNIACQMAKLVNNHEFSALAALATEKSGIRKKWKDIGKVVADGLFYAMQRRKV